MHDPAPILPGPGGNATARRPKLLALQREEFDDLSARPADDARRAPRRRRNGFVKLDIDALNNRCDGWHLCLNVDCDVDSTAVAKPKRWLPCGDRPLYAGERLLLRWLIDHADFRSASVHDATKAEMVKELHLGPSARRYLPFWLRRLEHVGAIVVTGLGPGQRGSIHVVNYHALQWQGKDRLVAPARQVAGVLVAPAREVAGVLVAPAREVGPEPCLSPAALSAEEVLPEEVLPEEEERGHDDSACRAIYPPLECPDGHVASRTADPAEVDAVCDVIAGFVEAGGDARPSIDPRWRRATAAKLKAGVARSEIERVMRWALCEDEKAFWSTRSGCDVPRLLEAKFETMRRQADQAHRRQADPPRRRPSVNPLTAPTEDRATSGLVLSW